jgi:hypothetical protein
MRHTIEGGYGSPDSAKALAHLKEIGATSVSILPLAFARAAHPAQPRAPSDDLTPPQEERGTSLDFVDAHPRARTDESILRVVSDARELGMSVLVQPEVWVEESYLGRVALPDEDSWRTWFDSYRRFVVHHAVVAELAGASVFCVGTELSASEPYEKSWRAVISAVRLATGAPLFYAAKSGPRAAEITFWDALDGIGAALEEPLAKAADKASDATLTDSVRRAVRPLAETSHKYSGRPVILVETGYRPVRGAWAPPQEDEPPRAYAPDDAARCVAAVYRALSKEPWWKGIYWREALSDGSPASPGERAFNFLGSPVEKAIAEGFQALSRRGAP